MIKITKMEYETFSNMCGFEIDEESYFEYYSISNEYFNGYFVAYDNEFHKKHKYIYPKLNFKNVVNIKDVFQAIKKYFNKPLLVMVDSKEIVIVSSLIDGGFKLKRRSYECNFKITDLKKQLNLIKGIKTN